MAAPSLQNAAARILGSTAIEDKLEPFDAAGLPDVPSTARVADTPARSAAMTPRSSVDRLPALRELVATDVRAACLHRFANHELQAIELFAWAILRFPEAPASFRRALAATLLDEQRHLRLYLDRMACYGIALGDEPLTGNFLAQAPLLDDPMKFVCAMGLTFENANLDFSLLYRDALSAVGAPDDAGVLDRIHRDELGHVALALSWLRRMKRPDEADLDAYLRNIPFPLGLHRAKGRNFVASARRSAGFDAQFIDAMRAARSPQQDPSLRR